MERHPARHATPSLVRALGVADVTWLYLVAIFNLNIIPVAAAEGMTALWLWGIAVVGFFAPQAVAVLELAEQMPGEGGLYLWSKQTFGDFHGFLCGWCYWLTNLFFVPSLLFYLTGVTAYVGAASVNGLDENRLFFLLLTNILLWVTILANVRGLGVGKWINNVGGIGSLVITAMLIALAAAGAIKGQHRPWSELTAWSVSSRPLAAIGVFCMALVGLEIGPVMGDEVRHPRRTFPRAILLGGGLCVIAYVMSTVSLVFAVPQSEMKLVQGLMQAIDRLSSGLGVRWMLLPLGLLMFASIAGSTSAWVSGSARMLFVSGLDKYLPATLGRVHGRYHSPHIALYVFGALASAVLGMSFIGVSIREAYVTLLDLTVALQMISYLYVFAVLLRHAFSGAPISGHFPRWILCAAGVAGSATTTLALVLVFVPPERGASMWIFETKMVSILSGVLAVAVALYLYYAKQKLPAEVNA